MFMVYQRILFDLFHEEYILCIPVAIEMGKELESADMFNLLPNPGTAWEDILRKHTKILEQPYMSYIQFKQT